MLLAVAQSWSRPIVLEPVDVAIGPNSNCQVSVMNGQNLCIKTLQQQSGSRETFQLEDQDEEGQDEEGQDEEE